MKKVVVVGGGIAGLSAGVYALQSGFDVTILEQHTLPGGNCTSWKRKGYLFEGGLHWLTGSSSHTPINKVWRNVGALDDTTKIYLKDPFLTYYYKGQGICLYRNPDRLEKHLLEVSPEDEKAIKSLCKDIRKFSKMSMPVQDVKGVKTRYKNKMPASMLFDMLPILPKMGTYQKMSVYELSQKFKHPGIRAMINSAVGETMTANALMFTLGCIASGDGGYVEGGSLTVALNMARRFTKLGGTIQYAVPVEKIIVENGKTAGVVAKGQIIKADAVIVANDTVKAIDCLFDKPLQEPWMEELRKNVKFMVDTFISIGVEIDLSLLPENMIFPLEQPISFAGRDFHTFSLNNYAAYKNYAPAGCTALTTFFMGDTYDYWKGKKESGKYEAEKEKIAEKVIALIEQILPQTVGKVAVIDVATPLTYERYCGTYHGSWMTLVEKGDKMRVYPSCSSSIQNLYFAGHRIQPPGGLPVAVDTGRKAVQYLCKDTDTVFQGKI